MIFKSNHKRDFTVLPNNLIRGNSTDPNSRADNLTAEGLGILAYLLSHQEDWQVCGKQMAAHWSISPNKMTKITTLLESEGYLKRVYRKDRGHIWDWIVTDTPHDFGEDRKIRDRIFEDRKNKDRKSCDQRSTKSLKEKLKTKERKKDIADITGYINLSDAVTLCPDRVPLKPWTDWLTGKTTTKKISSRQVKNAHAQFQILRDAGLKNFEQAVAIANSKDWKSIQPHWEQIKNLISASTYEEGVK
jgi:hypothetical protein